MAKRLEEIELTFEGPPSVAARLPRAPVLAAASGGEGRWERLDTTYVDTKDGALAAAGLSLRWRDESGALVQAVKRPHAHGGAVVRDEIET
ncbi:MAG: CYTH domain-containing protein, partial [Hyphococcus sp.]